MSSAILSKREHIALEILKTLLAHEDQTAINDAFKLADEFLAVSQADSNHNHLLDIVTPSPTVSDNATPQPSIAVKIFNHDHPKVNKENR